MGDKMSEIVGGGFQGVVPEVKGIASKAIDKGLDIALYPWTPHTTLKPSAMDTSPLMAPKVPPKKKEWYDEKNPTISAQKGEAGRYELL